MSSPKSDSKSQNLSILLTVKKSSKEVFEAIKDVKAWWVGQVEGSASQVGSEFTYAYKTFHRSVQKVTEMVDQKKIVWHVTDGFLAFTKDQNEWVWTDIVFDIRPKGDETEIQFTHVGITREVECFEACSGGWDFYINKSLKSFLMTGKGLDPGF